MSSLQFKSVLLEISNQLSADQLDKLKFLCGDLIGKRIREKITTGTQLFQALEEINKLGPDDTDFLSQLLKEIPRPDLAKLIDSYESQSGNTENQPDEQERKKLDIAADVIAENLGRYWRKLGRCLHLSEVKLDSISRRHPTDLEETVRELLKEWRKSRGAKAQTQELIKALRDCNFNLTADKVEGKLEAANTAQEGLTTR